MSPFLLRWVLRGRCWIWGSLLGSDLRWPKLRVDVCANLTANSGRMHLCPSTATVADDASAWAPDQRPSFSYEEADRLTESQ